MCACCGKFATVEVRRLPVENYPIREFCVDCNLNRCDAFPTDCWNKEK